MKPISTTWQRTPISYYGGKQTMLPHILPLIPEHTIYTEAFFGGGAVFWAKQPVKTEIITTLILMFIPSTKSYKHALPNSKPSYSSQL